MIVQLLRSSISVGLLRNKNLIIGKGQLRRGIESNGLLNGLLDIYLRKNNRMVRKLRNLLLKIYNIPVRARFKSCKSYLLPSVDVTNPKYITIGTGVSIRPHTWIYAIEGDHTNPHKFNPELIINDGVNIGRFCHITCSKRLELGKNVFLTERVLITDSIHGYKDINTPIYAQPLISKNGVSIGENTWIGNGASIVGDVTIGKGCVIATNTVLSNTSIPDYCVVMGIPGKIVKKYSPETGLWENT